MANFSSPDSHSPNFLRAATPPAARFPFLDLAATGFIACAALSLMLSTPGAVRAETKPSIDRRDAQTSVTKTGGVASQLSRKSASPLQTLRPVAASAHRAANSKTKNAPRPQPETRVAARVKPVESKIVENGFTDSPWPIDLLGAAPTESAPARARIAAVAKPAADAKIAPIVETTSAARMAATTETPAITEEPAPSATPKRNSFALSEPLTGTVDFGSVTPPARSTPAPDEVETPVNSAAPTSTPVASSAEVDQTAAQDAQNSRLYAPSISYEGGTIVAEGTPENPVRLESNDARIIAQRVRLDTIGKTVSATGTVRVERQVTVERFSAFNARGREDGASSETITEVLEGENFEYNYETRQGQLGATSIRLANFNVSAESLTINGQKYIARNVIVRPGGLSEEELAIYGTPPFNLRLREFSIDMNKPATSGADVSDTAQNESASVNLGGRAYGKGGALYFKNTRLLPVPSALFNRKLGRREEATYQITPRVYYNSADGLLLTTKLFFPFSQQNPDRLTLAADIGLSTRVGFRGGLQLESDTRLGDISLGARINDVVVSQLTNRIVLDRLPEIQYRPPSLRLFDLPGGRSAGLRFGFIAGDYRERFNDGRARIQSSRYQGQVRFTTRMRREDGPYLDLFARAAQYSNHFENLRTAGYEVGYIGPLTSRIAGQFSYSATNVSGSTPFRFDEVEIRKELRATFDILLTPRYIVPIDLRYDIERGELRDKSIGILRNYKTFAYGLIYQSARQELKLEIRQGF